MSNPERCKQMAKEITKQLAEESKRDAKGVEWSVYQIECDRNEGLESENEMLKAKVSELEDLAYMVNQIGNGVTVSYKEMHESTFRTHKNMKDSLMRALDTLDRVDKDLNKANADAIREAVKSALVSKNHPYHWSVIRDDMNEYADKLEAGEL